MQHDKDSQERYTQINRHIQQYFNLKTCLAF